MKEKILVFVIGVLLGAIVTATGFLIYTKINGNKVQLNPNVNGPMQIMQDGFKEFDGNKKVKGQKNWQDNENSRETMPEIPNEKNQGTLPEMPLNNQNSNQKSNKIKSNI